MREIFLVGYPYHEYQLTVVNNNKNYKSVRIECMHKTYDWTYNLQQKVIVSNNLTTCCSTNGTDNLLLEINNLLCWNASVNLRMRRKFTT